MDGSESELKHTPLWKIFTLCVLFSTFIKYAMGLWGYSGEGVPPTFGDYEAQRHWLEVTLHFPVGEWYFYDLEYWGLDYPPLTAYVSWGFGVLAELVQPPLVAFETSRGIETPSTKVFMRLTVLLCDLVVLVPVVWRIASRTKLFSSSPSPDEDVLVRSRAIMFTAMLLSPGLLLIDHGHFQYNCVAIGLSLLGAESVLANHDITGSVLFCLALNFKQMALYYAPVFFCVLLRKCLVRPGWLPALWKLVQIAASVILTFTALWIPFCLYPAEEETCFSSLLQVLHRLFPFKRGIFEDKVSNLWYVASVLFDFRQLVDTTRLVHASLALTLLLLAPVMIDLVRHPVDGSRLRLAMTSSALAFFLASFQVHEKSLLLVLVPASALAIEEPTLVCWIQLLGAFSIFPLLRRDGLVIPYYAANTLCTVLHSLLRDRLCDIADPSRCKASLWLPRHTRTVLIVASVTGMAVLHAMELCIPPPSRYPDLYPALFSIFSALNLCVVYVLMVYWQLSAAPHLSDVAKPKLNNNLLALHLAVIAAESEFKYLNKGSISNQ